ncbi:MAG: hypothetical protein WD208_09045 [Dehalococcoidia bacterium]
MRHETHPEQPNDPPAAIAHTRRVFLGRAAGAGAALIGLYVAPSLASTAARPAYAAGTPAPTATPPTPAQLVDNQVKSFSSSSSAVDVLAFNKFNPALGTLDKVFVSIIGQMSADGINPPVGIPPLLQPFSVNVETHVDSLIDGFAFGTPAIMSLSGTGFPVSGSFTFSFEFGQASDLVGFVPPSGVSGVTPPVTINGTRSDFIDTAGLGIGWQIQFRNTHILTSGSASVTTSSANGAVNVQYFYTPSP